MKKQSGSALLEVIISLGLLSILLFGIDGMQMLAIKEAKTNYYYQVATQQLNNLVTFILFAPKASIENQLNEWNKQNQLLLPNGRGVLLREHDRLVATLFWGQNKFNICKKNTIGIAGCLAINIKE